MTITEAKNLVKELGPEAARKFITKSSATITDDNGNVVEFSISDAAEAPADDAPVDTGELSKRIVADVVKQMKAENAALHPGTPEVAKKTVPARAASYRTKAFAAPGVSIEDANYNAYSFGMYVKYITDGSETAKKWLTDQGIITKANYTSANSAGGATVPEQFLPDLIRLVEDYGVFRRNSRTIPMAGDTLTIPRRTGGLTAYFTGEATSDSATAITKSSLAFTNVQLIAKKLAAYTLSSSELNEDAAISIGDLVVQEAALAFATKEDDCGFNGTGTSTYGGIQGILSFAGSASISTSVTGNTAFSTLDAVDFESAMGKLPLYARMGAKWYISSVGWAASMMRLAQAAGGNTTSNVEGGTGLSYLGYPVELTQIMNSTTTAQAGVAYAAFGNLSLGTLFGDRRSMTVSVSDQRFHDTDQIGTRITERFDIACHTFNSTAAAGPVIVLKFAAS